MEEQFLAKVWISGTGYVINIPKKIIKFYKIKKGDYFKIIIKSVNKK